MNEQDVISFDTLYESMTKCRKGVIWKDSVAGFSLRGVEKVKNLSNELIDGTYKARPPRHFTITSPKRREIASIDFRDRVYQRSLNDNVVYPVMTNSFIHDNYACQKDKGTDAARDRLKVFLREHYRKYGTSGYVAQFDIHGYYPNMDHKVAEDNFKRKLPDWAYQRVETILHEQYEGETGYNPGSQLVQIAGISVLDGLDHYIKEQLHIKHYIRYMDDLVLIHENRDYLLSCQEKIVAYLASMKFEVNPKKTKVYPLSKGIGFLGFDFKLTESGKVLMFIKPKNVKQQRKKLYRLIKKSLRGEMPKSKVDESYAAWRNHASKGNSFKLLQRMDKYYKDLWKINGGNDNGIYQQNQDDTSGACSSGTCACSGKPQYGEH